ncbi:MAG: ABC transporter substrate-binding protein [Desulfobacteraceae bacterium]|nr:MAG: ABC transporter substrate-binding protein [Desulfobacteraceae bacterium]
MRIFLRLPLFRAAVCFLLIMLPFPAAGLEEQPIETLRTGIEAGLQILRDPIFDDNEMKKVQQRKLWEIIEQMFDFQIFSKLVLSSRWEEFNPEQQEAFIHAFGQFLGKFYLGKLQEKYAGETVKYVKQQVKSETLAVVHIEILWKGREVPVEVRMLKRKNSWKAYDLQALGISAVANYRVQLGSILRKETPEQVVERLKNKIDQIEKQEQTG